MNRRFLGIVVVVIVLGIAGFFAYRQINAASASSTDVQTAQVERGTLVSSVSSSGTIAALQTTTLTWQISGIVGQVRVAVGDVVAAGDVLMELDPDRADPEMLQAQVDLLAAQENLDSLLAGPTEQELADAELAVIQAQQAITTAQRSLNSVLNPVSATLVDAVEDAKVTLDTATADQQLASVSSDVVALQNQIFVTTWYLNRLNQIKEESKGYEGNPDVQAKIQGAQLDYQNQYDKQMQLQLKVNTSQSTTANEVRNAQATYDAALANLQAAQSGPDAAKVTLYQAKLEVAQADLKQAETDLATLQASPDAQDVAAAQAKVAAAQAVVDRAQLIAPISGTVVAIYHNVGDEAEDGQTAVEIADLSSLEIEVSIAEVDINSVAVGQTAELTVDAAPDQTFQGQVTEVAYLGTSQQGVVNFPVTLVIADPDPALKPGMTAAVAIVTEQHENALLVPNRALRSSGGQRTVTVLYEGQQISVPVTVGPSNDTSSEILDGQLKEGDVVVVSGSTATTTTTTSGQGGGPGFFIDGGGGPPSP